MSIVSEPWAGGKCLVTASWGEACSNSGRIEERRGVPRPTPALGSTHSGLRSIAGIPVDRVAVVTPAVLLKPSSRHLAPRDSSPTPHTGSFFSLLPFHTWSYKGLARCQAQTRSKARPKGQQTGRRNDG
jgi:hypothetical protein